MIIVSVRVRIGGGRIGVCHECHLLIAYSGSSNFVGIISNRLVNDADGSGNLVPNDPIFQKTNELVTGERSVDFHDGMHSLAKIIVWKPDNDSCVYVRMFTQGTFYLCRVYVEASGDDHVNSAVADI
jgi:hypothetical protein